MKIEIYIQKLASLKVLQDLAEDKRLELFDKLVQVYLSRVFTKASEKLSEAQLSELEGLIEKQGEEAVLGYLEEHVADLDTIAQQEVDELIVHSEAVLGS